MFPILQKLSAFPKSVLQTFRAPEIGSPEKELRFTRSRQAVPFWIAGLFFLITAFAVTIASTQDLIASTWWALLPLALSLVFLWAAAHLTRHAYIILTPIGIELFPLFFPSKNLNVVYWPEVEAINFDENHTQMVIDVAGGSKIFLTLSPIRKDRIAMLVMAAEGRMAEKQ